MTARLIMKLRVENIRHTAPEVLHLELVHPQRPVLPEWTAGAHVDLRLPDGRIRQYSLCGDPLDRSRYEIAIKREMNGRGGSIWAHENLQEGSEAHVSAPRNNFPLNNKGERYILIAGGIGITPLLAMARSLRHSGREFAFHYCTRSRVEAPLLDELVKVCGENLHCWFSKEGKRFEPSVIGPYTSGTQIYMCGPQGLLDSVVSSLSGWPDDNVHIEAFQMTSDENFKPEPFEVTLASTGETFLVPADKSMLDVLRQHDFLMSSSCEIGLCGSCECGYRDGVVIHRDKVLPTSKRQDRLMLCVSRARVSVTLEL